MYRINRLHIPQILSDIILIAAAFSLAFYIRFDFSIPSSYLETLKDFILPVTGVKIVLFYICGLYRRIWRYTSLKDLYMIIWSSLLGTLAIIVIIFFISRTTFPRSVIALDGIFTVAFTAAIRISVRWFHEFRLKRRFTATIKPALIVGAGDTGETILREMLKQHELAYHPVGLIDDDPAKLGQHIHGVKVLGTRRQLSEIIKK